MKTKTGISWKIKKQTNRSDPCHYLYIGFSKLLIENRSGGIKKLQMNLKKNLIVSNRKLNIIVTRIAKPYGSPNILTEFIADQLKNRVSFRKAMKKAIELTEQADTKGIQVQISGRIDGKKIARFEWIREDRVPLQTIRVRIIYKVLPKTQKKNLLDKEKGHKRKY